MFFLEAGTTNSVIYTSSRYAAPIQATIKHRLHRKILLLFFALRIIKIYWRGIASRRENLPRADLEVIVHIILYMIPILKYIQAAL